MAAVTSATSRAVSPAVSQEYLNVDNSAADKGYGPAEYGQGKTVKNQVGGPSTESPLTTSPVVAPEAGGMLSNTMSTEAAYPHVNSGFDELYQQPALQREHGAPQGIPAARSPYPQDNPQSGRWSDEEQLQTNDLRSYDTDNHGWQQLVPNNRVSTRRTWGHSNPLNNPTWMGYSENPAIAHLAIAAADYNSYDNADIGGYQFSNGSTPDLWVADGSSVAYETPQPPPTTNASSVIQASGDPAEGWA